MKQKKMMYLRQGAFMEHWETCICTFLREIHVGFYDFAVCELKLCPAVPHAAVIQD